MPISAPQPLPFPPEPPDPPIGAGSPVSSAPSCQPPLVAGLKPAGSIQGPVLPPPLPTLELPPVGTLMPVLPPLDDPKPGSARPFKSLGSAEPQANCRKR